MSEIADKKQILKDRARKLAREPKVRQASGATLEVIEFALANERYAVETAYVDQVYPFKDLTPLPCTPPFVLGIINVRGKILAVIDIKKFFDLPEKGITDLHKVIIVRKDDIELGILADAVIGVRSIPLDEIQPSLPTLTGIREDYLKGVWNERLTSERLVVLDVAKILADKKIIVNEEVEI